MNPKEINQRHEVIRGVSKDGRHQILRKHHQPAEISAHDRRHQGIVRSDRMRATEKDAGHKQARNGAEGKGQFFLDEPAEKQFFANARRDRNQSQLKNGKMSEERPHGLFQRLVDIAKKSGSEL